MSKKKVFVFGSLLIVIIVIAGVILFTKNRADYYTEEDIQALAVKSELVSKDIEVNGTECVKCYFTGKKSNYYSELDYYLFSSEEDAQEAFKYLTYKDFNHQGNGDYEEGILYGVYDATISRAYRMMKNMVVFTDTEGPTISYSEGQGRIKAIKSIPEK